MTQHIHLVDADPGVRQLVHVNLCMAGFRAEQSCGVHEAWMALQPHVPDLVLLGNVQHQKDALDLLRRLRASARLRHLPVLVLSASGSEADILAAFEAGADDVMHLPFHPRLLIARIQALLRRVARSLASGALDVDGLRIDPEAGQAWAAGRGLRLRATDFRLLHTLLRRPSRVHSREELLTAIWPDAQDVSDRVVDVCVARLRAELDGAGHYPCIETVRAVGYRLVRREELLVHG